MWRAAPGQKSSTHLGSHKWDKDPVSGRLCVSQPKFRFLQKFCRHILFHNLDEDDFLCLCQHWWSQESLLSVGEISTMHCAAPRTCSTGCVYPSSPFTDLLEAIYGLWRHHPLPSLRCWLTMWPYYMVKPFSLPLSTKVWPIHINHYRKASYDQKIMGQVSNKLGLSLETWVQNYTCLWWCPDSCIQSHRYLPSAQGQHPADVNLFAISK